MQKVHCAHVTLVVYLYITHYLSSNIKAGTKNTWPALPPWWYYFPECRPLDILNFSEFLGFEYLYYQINYFYFVPHPLTFFIRGPSWHLYGSFNIVKDSLLMKDCSFRLHFTSRNQARTFFFQLFSQFKRPPIWMFSFTIVFFESDKVFFLA